MYEQIIVMAVISSLVSVAACKSPRVATPEGAEVSPDPGADAPEQHVDPGASSQPEQAYPFKLGPRVEPSEVTAALIAVSAGVCPGSLPTVSELAATPLTTAPREITRDQFLNMLELERAPDTTPENVRVENPEVMHDFYVRAADHLATYYPGSAFAERVDRFTCVLAMEDAGCERLVCMSPPTSPWTDGALPEEQWLVLKVYYGNVRREES